MRMINNDVWLIGLDAIVSSSILIITGISPYFIHGISIKKEWLGLMSCRIIHILHFPFCIHVTVYFWKQDEHEK